MLLWPLVGLGVVIAGVALGRRYFGRLWRMLPWFLVVFAAGYAVFAMELGRRGDPSAAGMGLVAVVVAGAGLALLKSQYG